MCIIAIKKQGVEMPSDVIIKNMFQRNPDGAGFMYLDKDINKVRIEKGIMDVKTYLKKVKRFTSEDTVVMHFRIGTSGGNIPANTHPFMVSENFEDLKKLKGATDIAVVHNGIIDITPSRKDVSDTMEFIANRLAYIRNAIPEFYKDENILKWIENEIDSKLCIMTGLGEIVTIGKFNEMDGVMYSNYTYEDSKIYKAYSYDDYDWDKYDWEKYDSKIASIISKDKKPDALATIDKHDIKSIGDDFNANRYVMLYRLPTEYVVYDEVSGEYLESKEYVIDDDGNLYAILDYNEELQCEECMYDQDLAVVTVYGDYITKIDYEKLDYDLFYEVFMY